MAITNDTKPIDQRIDAVFGEAVVLKPMSGGGYREAVPDPNRTQVVARGIFDQTRGAVEDTSGGFLHRQATVGVALSIRMEPINQCNLKKGDRVHFPERGETYEVTFIHDDPGGRPDVHLVEVLDEG